MYHPCQPTIHPLYRTFLITPSHPTIPSLNANDEHIVCSLCALLYVLFFCSLLWCLVCSLLYSLICALSVVLSQRLMTFPWRRQWHRRARPPLRPIGLMTTISFLSYAVVVFSLLFSPFPSPFFSGPCSYSLVIPVLFPGYSFCLPPCDSHILTLLLLTPCSIFSRSRGRNFRAHGSSPGGVGTGTGLGGNAATTTGPSSFSSTPHTGTSTAAAVSGTGSGATALKSTMGPSGGSSEVVTTRQKR